MMKLYVSLLSRNYDIFSGFDIRLAAQPVAATFSFGRTVVCFHATICAHTLDTALLTIRLCFSLFFSFFLTPFFNMPRIQLGCQPDFRRDYVLHCLFDIIC